MKVQTEKLSLRASIEPKTFDRESRTVEVTASTGAQVRRFDFRKGEFFMEELEISRKAIRLERFRNGAPILDTHGNTKGFLEGAPGIRDIMGVVVSAEVREGTLRAKVKFSEREEFDGVIRDIEAGVIRNVSVGYVPHSFKDVTPRGKGEDAPTRVMRAVDWEPYELSFVPMPADAGATVRNKTPAERIDCEVIEESETETINERGADMPPVDQNQGEENQTPAADAGNSPSEERGNEVKVDENKIREEAIAAERARCQEIRTAVKQAKLGEDLAEDMVGRGISADEARSEVLAKLAENDKAETRSTVEVGEDNDVKGRHEGMKGAILHRIAPSKHKLDDQSKGYRFMSLVDMVRESLTAQGQNVRGLSPMEVATRGLHSTSDFPEILANVTNKTLRDAYEESPQTFAPFVRRVSVSDFKEISRTQLGDAPQLLEKLENGEYQAGTISEQAEKYSVSEYGRMVPIGRRVIVNDDLDAFTRLPAMMGRQARNLESDLIWTDVIVANPTMADGNALFSVAHGNLNLGGASVIDVASLGAARAGMRAQTSLDGSKLNLSPLWLYVPVALETTADSIVAPIVPEAIGNVNPFGPGGRTPLRAGVEPRLDDASATAWYVMADMGQVDMIELATLIGEEGPVIDSMIDFDTDGIKFKVRHTVGAKAIDHRGFQKNDGV
jgi:hypothetical protein